MMDVVLSTQWGDKGKGKIVNYLSEEFLLVLKENKQLLEIK